MGAGHDYNLTGNASGTTAITALAPSTDSNGSYIITYTVFDDASGLYGTHYAGEEEETYFATGTDYKGHVRDAFYSILSANTQWGTSFEDVAKISFQSDANGYISIGQVTGSHSEFSPNSGRMAFSKYAPTANIDEHGDIFINVDHLSPTYSTDLWDVDGTDDANNLATNSIESGEYAWTVIHQEILHSLGVDIYADSAADISLFDSHKYSITSYNYHPGMGGYSTTDGTGPHAPGLQLYDIAALQEIYGRQWTTRDGDTTYKAGASEAFGSASSPFIYTIWDGAGHDTIDASAYTNGLGAIIDLRQGMFSSIGYNTQGGSAQENVAIAYHAIIEDAIGTANGDILIGNAWDNVITGGGGNDRIFGDGMTLEDDSVIDQIYKNDDGFGAESNEHEIENPGLAPASDKSGDDTLDGGAGDDWLYGGAGADTLIGGDGNDQLFGGAGDDNLSGGAGDDLLRPGGGTNDIEGGSGTDTVDYSDIGVAVDVDLAAGTDSLGNSLTSIEGVSSSSYGGVISATSGVDAITTGIYGNSFVSTLAGDDRITVNLGDLFYHNQIDGGDGFDQVIFSGTGHAFNGIISSSDMNLMSSGTIVAEDATLYNVESITFDHNVSNPGYVSIYGIGWDIDLDHQQTALPYFDYSNIDSGLNFDLIGNESWVFYNNQQTAIDTYRNVDRGPYSYSARYVGTNSGDIITANGPAVYFQLGSGNDTVNIQHSVINTLTQLTFNGGTDSVYGAINGSTRIFLNNFVQASDVTFAMQNVSLAFSYSSYRIYDYDLEVIVSGQGSITAHDIQYRQYRGADNIFDTADDTYQTTNYMPRVLLSNGTGLVSNDINFAFTDTTPFVSVTQSGTSGDDVIYGTNTVVDVLHGNSGNDVIYGTDGENRLFGGDGDDTFHGGSGRDYINAGLGNDTAYGGAGNDFMSGSQGDDHLVGQNGIDSLHGENGDDFLDGGSDNDYLYGGLGSDLLIGGSGNDELYGYQHSQYVQIDLSSNTFVGGEGNDKLYGSLGTDTADYSSSAAGVAVNLASGTATGDGSDTLYSIENVVGSAYNDTITGDANDNELSGGLGDDTFVGSGGSDIIDGGSGTDTVDYSAWTSRIELDFINGVYDTNDDGLNDSSFISIENFIGTTYDDLIRAQNNVDNMIWGLGGNDTLRGQTGDDQIWGGDGQDTLTGEGGIDTLLGEAGDDTINGGGDDDEIHGGAGEDTIRGNEGDDLLYGDGDRDYIYGDEGEDEIHGGAGNDFLIGGLNDSDTVADTDTIHGDDGNDFINGSLGNDFLYGGNDNDTLLGGAGDDFIQGDAGSDYLYGDGGSGNTTLNGDDELNGGAGQDYLYGQNGNDILWAGEGADYLNGGTGSNTFAIYETAGLNNDLAYVVDWNTGTGNKIDLSELLSGYNSGTDDLTDFVNVGVGGNTTFQVDRDGTGTTHTWDSVIRLQSITSFETNVDTLVANGTLLVA